MSYLKSKDVFPPELTSRTQWLYWRITPNPETGKLGKEPKSCVVEGHASSSNPATWGDFDTATACALKDGARGLGFVLTPETSLVVLDIENCIDESGEVESWAQREVDALDSFTEISVSGKGLHVLFYGALPLRADGTPDNINAQKINGELWSCDKMFCLTGNIYEGRSTIQDRDAANLHARMRAGKFGPKYAPLVVYADDKFQKLCADEWQGLTNSDGLPYGSRSDAAFALLCMLGIKHKGDAEKMRAEFESTELYTAWEASKPGKWARPADREIERATQYAKKTLASKGELLFTVPKVAGTYRDFVVEALPGHKNGWWRLGEVGLIGGPSAAGKTRFFWGNIRKGLKTGTAVLGHPIQPRPYLVLMADRGWRDNTATLEDFGIDATREPVGFLQINHGGGVGAVAQAVVEQIEKFKPLPQVVFVEGLDGLVKDACSSEFVPPFLSMMGQIADHFNCAIIGSVGSPKHKAGEGYVAKREQIFGSQFWARLTGTIVSVQFYEGDDTDDRRQVCVLPRGAKAEAFDMTFNNRGELVLDTNRHAEDDRKGLEWLLAVKAAGGEFTRSSLKHIGLCKKATDRQLTEWLKRGWVRQTWDGKMTVATLAGFTSDQSDQCDQLTSVGG